MVVAIAGVVSRIEFVEDDLTQLIIRPIDEDQFGKKLMVKMAGLQMGDGVQTGDAVQVSIKFSEPFQSRMDLKPTGE